MHNQEHNIVDYKAKILSGVDMLWSLPLLRDKLIFLMLYEG
jgi:hypothetical protein